MQENEELSADVRLGFAKSSYRVCNDAQKKERVFFL